VVLVKHARGFTLIELLVVIVIIAVLAAMLFPVFARARESARKIQCLSSVKNIAAAFGMYLADYGDMPPSEHRPEAVAYFTQEPGPGGGGPSATCATWANPYLRLPAILEEYIRDRVIWRCPSARLIPGAHWILPGPDYLGYIQTHQGEWGLGKDSGGPCLDTFPTGWGGSVTDSIAQHQIASPGGRGEQATGAFEASIGTARDIYDLNSSAVDDPSWYVVCGDVGARILIWVPPNLAYPEACFTQLCNDCFADWENCPASQTCGISRETANRFYQDPEMRKRYERHLGGSNVGFMDGHAAWMPADAIIDNAPLTTDRDRGKLRGVGCSGTTVE
jgi:prepilin-type N-terminal cleavage/methylation domain-containing protein/prepilin-type processing-associated H-X9-DG protein